MPVLVLFVSLLVGCSGEGAPSAPASPQTAGAAAAAPVAAPGAAAGNTDPTAVPAGGGADANAEGLTPIRIGWQTTWSTQGQLVAVLMHSDILEKNGFKGDFQGFPYGGPLNEGALAGGVDVVLTADQPALSLAAKAPSWGIVGRLMYNRVGMFVPPDSPVQSAKDLAGKKLAVPFGAAAQREALAAISGAGLDPKKDVRVVNLGVEEILATVRAGARDGKWGEIDAAAAWDPTFAEIEHSNRGRTVASATVTSVVLMNDAFVAANPAADVRFMTALATAYDVYRADPARADRWFQQEAKLRFNLATLTVAASVEPNLSAKDASGIRVNLNDADVASLEKAETFMEEAGLLSAPLSVASVLRPSAKVAPPVGDAASVTLRP